MPRRRTRTQTQRQSRSDSLTRPALRRAVESLEPRLLLSTYTVTTTADSGSGSLREAIQNSVADTIQISVNSITLQSPLEITRDVAILGPEIHVVITSPASSVFRVDANATVEMADLSIGYSFGSGLLNEGRVSLSNCDFGENISTTSSTIANAGILNVINCNFTDNTSASGGAITNEGILAVAGGAFTDNKGGNGAAIENSSNAVLTVSNASFSRNRALGQGGAIDNSGSATISGAEFDSNHSYESGGAINNSGNLTLSGGTLSNNLAAGDGGGVSNSGTATITALCIANVTHYSRKRAA